MIDLTQLTENQLRGLRWALKKRNDEDQAAFQPPTDDPDAEFVPMTEQAYADQIFRQWCDSYYNSLQRYLENAAVEASQNLTPQQRSAVLTQLGVVSPV